MSYEKKYDPKHVNAARASAQRTEEYKEFCVTCKFMQVQKAGALREAMHLWLTQPEQTAKLQAIMRRSQRVRESKPDVYQIFDMIAEALDLPKMRAVSQAIKGWLDKNRLPDDVVRTGGVGA